MNENTSKTTDNKDNNIKVEINNNNMFNSKDQSLLKKNEELILLGCSFSGWVGNSMVTRFEYIIVPENINLIELRRGLINKKKLIKIEINPLIN